jgi:hypothetical protein
VATLARVITRHGNRVGALLYGQRVHGVLPARTGRQHVLELLQRMQAPAPGPAAGDGRGTRLAELLHAAEGSIPRRSVVFVVSDFISQPGWAPALSRLARRHDVVAVRLWDPLEMDLPDAGLVTLQDAETGEQLFVDASSPAFRERYAELAEQQEAQLRLELATSGADVLELAIFGDKDGEKLADVVFDPIKDRHGRSILTVRDQNTYAAKMRQKRLMTVVHLWLVNRFKADAVYYVAPTEDNVYQTEKMKAHGIFSSVNKDVGEIIVADVNQDRIAELLAPDRVALQKLIRKED